MAHKSNKKKKSKIPQLTHNTKKKMLRELHTRPTQHRFERAERKKISKRYQNPYSRPTDPTKLLVLLVK